MELKLYQVQALGYALFGKKFDYSPKYLIPAVSFLALFAVILAVLTVSVSDNKPSEYIIPDYATGRLTIEQGGVFIGDTRLSKAENNNVSLNNWRAPLLLLPLVGVLVIMLWWVHDKEKWVGEYVEYYFENKKLRE